MARFFESITLTNFLSFGPESTTLELEDVNVLVGANGSGKSNLIEAINVLRHAPRDIAQPLREGGGIREYLWRPQDGGKMAKSATIEIALAAGAVSKGSAQYSIELGETKGNTRVVRESMRERDGGKLYFEVSKGVMATTVLKRKKSPRDSSKVTFKHSEVEFEVDSSVSVLAQHKDHIGFSQGTLLGENLEKCRIYRNWTYGSACPLRFSRRPDAPTNSLLENYENFPSRLATLKSIPSVKRRLLEFIKNVSPGFDDIEIVPEGGALQLYLIEGDRKISSYRLSDGTLRYLMLLTIFLDPAPPPVIVIEEPEISLHPDVLPSLRDLILKASERTQIILATQSPTFLDAWTDHASFVVVCEREDDSTIFERLDPADYPDTNRGLGDRWTRGEIGGNRW